MNANQLLDVIGEAKDQYLLSAVNAPAQPARRHSIRKPMLVAAIIALTMLLVGCAAVYVLHLQDMKAGESSYTKKLDQFGKAIDPTEVTVELVTPHGLKNSPMQLATLEWQDFLDQYDPNHELLTDDNEAGIPDQYYYTYSCYTWDMVKKLDEIAAKYDLKLLDKYTLAQRYQKDVMYAALGIEGVIRPGVNAQIEESAGELYPNGNFESHLFFTLTGEDAAWTSSCYVRFYYAKKDTFQPLVSGVIAGDFEQWNYTTADGTPLLLVLEANGESQIFADVGDATVFIDITPDTPGIYPRDESEIPSKEALEQMADLFDYQVRPQPFAIAGVQAKLDESEAAYEAQNTFELPEYHSFGEYLFAQPYLENKYYCLFDLNADGIDEMLISYGDGAFRTSLFMQDGLVQERITGAAVRLCENGVLESSESFSNSYHEKYIYEKAEEVDGRFNYFSENSQWIGGVQREWGTGSWFQVADWYCMPGEGTPCTVEEARAYCAQFVPLKLDWKPILDYPMEVGGLTLAQYARANDPYVPNADLPKLYAEFALGQQEKYGELYYTLRDINGDDKLDLLLSESPDGSLVSYTENRGRVRFQQSLYFNLCQGNVFETVTNGLGDGEEAYCEFNEYCYFRLDGTNHTYLDYVRHNLSTDTWYIDRDGPEITEAEAQAIIAKYPRIKLNMKPISELTK